MKIQLKRSNTLSNGTAKEPTPDQMEYGELAVNYNDTDPAVFIKDSNNNIIRIAGEGSVSSDGIESGDTLPGGVEAGTVFFNTTDNILYYWNGSSWISINGNEAYVDVSGDNMTGNLTLGTNKITLNASTGNGEFTGKISTAPTIAGDGPTTLTTKGYVDSNRTIPGSGILNIKDGTGASLGTFNANASTGTETVISLPSSVAPTDPGDGNLTIKTNGEGASSTGTFSANQSGNTSLTLPAIRYQDLSGVPAAPASPGAGTLNIKDGTGQSLGTFNANASTGTETVISLPANVVPTAPGNGTITITQPGTSNQTFTVNQSGNTTIALKNDNTQNTPGSGSLTIKNYNDNFSASGNFNANQSNGSTITLKQISYNDLKDKPSIPSPSNTNLTNTATSTTVVVRSSTGSDTTIASASGAKAGVMTTTQVSDLSTAKSDASDALTTANDAETAANNAAGAASTAYNLANSAFNTGLTQQIEIESLESAVDTATLMANDALEQSIKAWARTNPLGSISSGNNLNCSSGATGYFQYTFKNSLGSAGYAVIANLSESTGTNNFGHCRVDSATSNGFVVRTWYTSNGSNIGASYEHSVMVIKA